MSRVHYTPGQASLGGSENAGAGTISRQHYSFFNLPLSQENFEKMKEVE